MLKSQGGSKFNEKHGSILLDNLHLLARQDSPEAQEQRNVAGILIG